MSDREADALRADFAQCMRNAAASQAAVDGPEAGQEVTSGPEPSPVQGPPPRPTLRRRLFGRIADYARRYLTASVEHRLTLLQEGQGALRDDLNRMAALQAELLQAQRHADSVLSDELRRLRLEILRTQQEVRGVPGVIGPRLDELEIKVRPLIDFDAESFAVRLGDGYVMAPKDRPLFAVMVANATSGGLEPGVRRILQALAREGGVAADVGANIGLLTLALARAVGPAGRVFAFEPEDGPRRQLEKTALLNGLKWVEIHDCAVGARAGTAVFHVSPVIGHSSLYELPAEEGTGRKIEVAVHPLDDLVPPGAKLDVVKIDVEGAELDVLEGMRRLLAENADLAIVAEFGPSHLARVGTTPEAWFAAFAEHGLTPYLIEEPKGVCRPITLDDVRDVESVNIAFVRPGGEAEGRLPR